MTYGAEESEEPSPACRTTRSVCAEHAAATWRSDPDGEVNRSRFLRTDLVNHAAIA